MSHVLQFAPDGALGGGTTVVLDLTRSLLALGHRVTVLTEQDSACALHAEAMGAGVVTGSFMQSRATPATQRLVVDTVNQLQPNAIHLHGTRAAFFARDVRHPKVICTIHGYHFNWKPLLPRLIGWLGLKVSLGSISDFVFLTEYDRRIGQRWGLLPSSARSHIIPNGIALDRIEAPKVAKQVAYPHRLTLMKNPMLALRAMEVLAPLGYSLVCAGTGELEAECRSFAEAHSLPVAFGGGMTRESTLKMVAESEMTLLTSTWEGLPMTILESMALGTPVVSTAVAGIPEIIEDGVNGILIPRTEPRDVAEAVRRLADPERRQQVARNAIKTIDERFAWDKVFARYLALYEA